MAKINFTLKKDGKWTPLGRAVRVFGVAALTVFLASSGLSAADAQGVVDIAVVGKAALAGASAGGVALVVFVLNYLEKDS